MLLRKRYSFLGPRGPHLSKKTWALKRVLATCYLGPKLYSFERLHVCNCTSHPALKREDRLGKDPFAGFGTVVEDITESGYTKNQPILLGPF